jgi:hypothetical protein
MADYSDPVVIATMALVVVTGGLVVVTAFYAKQTKRTVEEMKRGNETQFLPFLIVDLDPTMIGPGMVRFIIENIGRGPALGLTIDLSANGESIEPKPSYFHSLRHGQTKAFDFHGGFQPNSDNTVNVQLNYKDVFGKAYPAQQTVEVRGAEFSYSQSVSPHSRSFYHW